MIWWGLGISVIMIGGLWWAPDLSRLLFGGNKVKADHPRSFGYKMAWLAVKTRDTAKLIDVLQVGNARSADWSTGLATVYSERFGLDRVFVTPPVDGWSHVVGLSLPHPMGDAFEDRCAPFLINLSREFGVVNYYASLPQLNYYAWGVLSNGEMNRGFACGAEGILWNRGSVLEDERTVGIDFFDLRLVEDKSRPHLLVDMPDNDQISEQHVLELARRWSLDPTGLDTRDDLEAGVGYLAIAPAEWRPMAARRQAA